MVVGGNLWESDQYSEWEAEARAPSLLCTGQISERLLSERSWGGCFTNSSVIFCVCVNLSLKKKKWCTWRKSLEWLFHGKCAKLIDEKTKQKACGLFVVASQSWSLFVGLKESFGRCRPSLTSLVGFFGPTVQNTASFSTSLTNDSGMFCLYVCRLSLPSVINQTLWSFT